MGVCVRVRKSILVPLRPLKHYSRAERCHSNRSHTDPQKVNVCLLRPALSSERDSHYHILIIHTLCSFLSSPSLQLVGTYMPPSDWNKSEIHFQWGRNILWFKNSAHSVHTHRSAYFRTSATQSRFLSNR